MIDGGQDPLPMLDMRRERELVGQAVENAVIGVLESGKFIMGPQVSELEEVLRRYVSVDHCVAVSSGTDALLLSLLALGVGPGDEVITTPFSWISSAEVISQAGATPVFADILEANCLLNPGRVKQAVTPRTKAIIAVSLFGQMPDFTALRSSVPSGIAIVEDAAQSFGARCPRTQRMSCGLTRETDISCTSFFPSKPLGCYGDGGAIFTARSDLAAKVRGLRVHGKMPNEQTHTAVGYNARLDTIQAAILLAKWPYFEKMLNARRRVAARYCDLLGPHPDVTVLDNAGDNDAYGVFTVVFKHTEARTLAQNTLKQDGISSAVYYKVPINKQPVFEKCQGDTPVSDDLSARVLSIPIHPFLSQDEQRRIVSGLVSGCSSAK